MYESWAAFYDEVYIDQHSSGDLGFYLAEAQRAGGAVLEAACGTGRILLPTRMAGVEIEGFDRSPAMLARLAEKACEQGLEARVWEDDMRTFRSERRYALITCPFRAFLHLLTTDDQLAAMGRFRSHLEPGGRLLLNVFHPSYRFTLDQQGQRVLEDEFVHRATNRHTRKWMAVTNDLVNQIKTLHAWFEQLDERGEVVEVTETEVPLAWIFRPQMELLLRAAGFGSWEIYGGFDRQPLVRDDQEMVVEAWA